MTLRQRMEHLGQLLPEVNAAIIRAAKDATIRAVETATDLTPPTENDLRGTNTRTGEMKQHWSTDSVIIPEKKGDEYCTYLFNDMQYASYVNDGHRMDMHFVKGLVLNYFSGLLEYNPDIDEGMYVGTRTKYVPGLHMTDEAQKVYEDVIREELKKVKDLLK